MTLCAIQDSDDTDKFKSSPSRSFSVPIFTLKGSVLPAMCLRLCVKAEKNTKNLCHARFYTMSPPRGANKLQKLSLKDSQSNGANTRG